MENSIENLRETAFGLVPAVADDSFQALATYTAKNCLVDYQRLPSFREKFPA